MIDEDDGGGAASVPGGGRLRIPTCTGCESINRWGTCESGCHEERLDVVRGDLVDWLEELAVRSRERADRLQTAVAEIDAALQAAAWADAHQAAAAALAGGADPDAGDPALDEPPTPVELWRCDACGGASAPHECLGICTWREIEWAPLALYERSLARAQAERAREARLRAVLRRVAHVHPRAGREAETAVAFARTTHELLTPRSP